MPTETPAETSAETSANAPAAACPGAGGESLTACPLGHSAHSADTAPAPAVPDYPFAVPDPFLLPVDFAALRRDRPVGPARVATGDEVWLVTRYADVREALADRRLSRDIFRPEAARLLPGVPTGQVSSPFVDPPAHTRWRKLVTRAFTPRHVEGMRGDVQKIVDDLVDGLEGGPRPADLVAQFGYPLSMRVLCQLLGVSDAHYATFRAVADTALSIDGAPAAAKDAARRELGTFAAGLVADKRAAAGPDLLSQLVAVVDAEDGRLSEQELVATVLAMFIGGYESAVHQVGKGLLALLRWPEQRAVLAAEPTRIGPAVEEMLRFAALDSGFGSPRFATGDVEIGGVRVPAGATVLVIRQSADRDPAEWTDPDRFDVRRDARAHTAFGHGPHRCLGAALARLELQTGIGTLLRRLPGLYLTVPPEQVEWDYRITAAGPRSLPVEW
jgi:cytochrome P450